MKKNNIAFSLIEVVIATGIITISIFGVYKLIGENTKIINNSGNILQVNTLKPVLEECIEYLGFSTYTKTIGQKYNFNFGSSGLLDGCQLGVGNKVKIDNIEYTLSGEIKGFSGNYIDWEFSIGSDTLKTITGSYKQISK